MSTIANTVSARQWRLNSLRFTYFLDVPVGAVGTKLFEDFFELKCDEETHRSAEFLSQYSTQKGSVVYQAVIVGPKVDFIAQVQLTQEIIESGFPVLPEEGNFPDRFLEAAKRLTKNEARRIQRIAVGAHHVLRVDSKDQGYSILSQYLSGFKLDSNSSDFQYRINRARSVPFNGQNVEINRLATWACLAMTFGMNLQNGKQIPPKIGNAVSVNTDVNTAPAEIFCDLQQDVRESVIGKLFDFTAEIPKLGDVP
jgi:hypothetical protein